MGEHPAVGGYADWQSAHYRAVLCHDSDRVRALFQNVAISPLPLATFASEETGQVGKSFIRSYIAVCLEGAIIVLACIIYSLFVSSAPSVNPNASAVNQVWTYVGEIVFNMLVLTGTIKLSDQVVKNMMGL